MAAMVRELWHMVWLGDRYILERGVGFGAAANGSNEENDCLGGEESEEGGGECCGG